MKNENNSFVGFTIDTIQAQNQRETQNLIDFERPTVIYNPSSITETAEQIIVDALKSIDKEDKTLSAFRQGFGPWS